MTRSLPKEVEELIKANAKSCKARKMARATIDIAVDDLIGEHGVSSQLVAEVLDGAAQRLRDEHEQGRAAWRRRRR